MRESIRQARKDNSKRKGVPAMSLERRRQEATARQEAYDSLTVEQKLRLLDGRPGKSAKERAKLLRRREGSK